MGLCKTGFEVSGGAQGAKYRETRVSNASSISANSLFVFVGRYWPLCRSCHCVRGYRIEEESSPRDMACEQGRYGRRVVACFC